MRVGYTFDSGVGLTANWRYYGSVDWQARSNDVDLGTAGTGASVGDIDAQSYFDMTFSYSMDPVTFRLGVNNVFDKEPPILGSSYGNSNGNTYVETYDPVGRRFFVSTTLQF